MRNVAIAISFICAVPFLIIGFLWNFIAYCFNKGREVCNTFFEYME